MHATNTPTLVSSSGTEGYYYIVGVEGSTNLNGITDWKVGDWVIWSESASSWQKVDNTSFESVTNQGTGAEIFKQVLNGTEVQLRSLVDGSIISLTQNADDIEIDDSNVVSISDTQTITGDKTFTGAVTSNSVFKSKGATIIEDSVFQVNKTSAPSITFNNSTGTSAYGLVGEAAGSINLDSYNGLDVELNSDNDVRIGATGDVNVTGNEINLNAPTNVDSSLDVADQVTIKKTAGNSILLVGDDTSTTTNNLTGFRVLARESDGDLFIDHKTKSGDVISYRCGEGAQAASSHTFMKVDPTDGDVTFGANVNVGGSLDVGSTITAASNIDLEYSLGYGSSFNKSLRIGASNETSVNINETYKWDFYVSGNQNGQDLSIRKWVRGGGQVEALKLKSNGALNLASTTNASPSTGDIWYDGTFVNLEGIVKTGQLRSLSNGNVVQAYFGLGATNGSNQNTVKFYYGSDEKGYINARGDTDQLQIVALNDLQLNANSGSIIADGALDVGGITTIKNDSGSSEFIVGDDTSQATNVQNGFKVNASSNGSLFIDHKTISGGAVNFRTGEGAETGNVHTFMQVDPTDGDVTFPTNVNVGGDLTANSATLDGSLTLDTNQIVMNNLGSAHGRITSINSAYMDVTASGTGVDLRLESQSGDVNILANGTTNIDGCTINGNLDVTNNLDVDGSITLEGSFQQSVNNTAFNVISRNNDNAPSLYVNNAGTGDIQVWQSDPTQTGQGVVARMYNDGSLDLSGVLNLASTTNASPSTGDIWRDATYTTINDDLKVRSDKPILQLASTKNGTWTAGERKGAINFYGSDASGGGPNVHAFIQAQTRDTFGAATELSFGVTDSGSTAVESLRLKASGALNYRPITNTSPEDGDVWRDSASGKLKFRENGVTYNFN